MTASALPLVDTFTLFSPPPAQYPYFSTTNTGFIIHLPIYSKKAHQENGRVVGAN